MTDSRYCKDKSGTGDLVIVTKQITVTIPDDPQFKRVVVGALYALTNPDYWIKSGSATVDQSVQESITMVNSLVET